MLSFKRLMSKGLAERFKFILDISGIKNEVIPDHENSEIVIIELYYETSGDCLLYGYLLSLSEREYDPHRRDWMVEFLKLLHEVDINLPEVDMANEMYDGGLSPEEAAEKYVIENT